MTLDKLVQTLLESGAHRATYYKTDKSIIRVTRTAERNRKGEKCFHPTLHDLRVTIGCPNAREQKFIKACKKAGESFPVKKAQLQFLKGLTGSKKPR